MDIRINGFGDDAILELPPYSVGQTKSHVPVRQISTYSLIDYNGIYGTEIVLISGQRVRAGCYPNDLSRAITASSHAENTRTNEVLRLTREYNETLQMAANQAVTIKEQINEIERLRKCCTQRGARMQIMREWLDSPHGIGPPTEWWYFCEERPEAKGWFDEDGVVL